MAKIKKKEVAQQIAPEEETPLTKSIQEFMSMLDTLPWNRNFTAAENKACEELVKQIRSFANHFGYDHLIR